MGEVSRDSPMPSIQPTFTKDQLIGEGHRIIVLDNPNPQQHFEVLKKLVYSSVKPSTETSVEGVKAQISQIRGGANIQLKQAYDQVVEKLQFLPDDKNLQKAEKELQLLMHESQQELEVDSISYAKEFSTRVGKKLMELSSTQLDWSGSVKNFFGSLWESMKSLGDRISGNPSSWALVRNPADLLASAKKTSAPPLPSAESRASGVAPLKVQADAEKTSRPETKAAIPPPLLQRQEKTFDLNEEGIVSSRPPAPLVEPERTLEEMMAELDSDIDIIPDSDRFENIRGDPRPREPGLFEGAGIGGFDARRAAAAPPPSPPPTAPTTPTISSAASPKISQKKASSSKSPPKPEPATTPSAPPRQAPKTPSTPQEWEAFYKEVEVMGKSARERTFVRETVESPKKESTSSVDTRKAAAPSPAPPPDPSVEKRTAEQIAADELMEEWIRDAQDLD